MMTTTTNNGTATMHRDNGGQERLLPPEGLSYSNSAVSRQCTHSSNIHAGLESGNPGFVLLELPLFSVLKKSGT